ncbi:RNA-binding protein spenito-like [Rhopalosiphum maidis]|uniref:RNA-binding protein spenito-like n=1 Tax=Rhopalosiphum maidis TaxID=43146 RepID=UPI000EFFB8A2|nr:RNA-binding protein spenito-like [Rhopalosiphum maidis]
MFGLSKDFKSEKIIVKIHNTKSKHSGDSPPMSRKKRHSSINMNNGSSDERKLYKYEYEHCRGRGRTPSRSSSHSKLDKFHRSRDLDRSRHTYKVLRINPLHPNASDQQVKEILYREYHKFGEFSVKISYEENKRLAYVCFRRSNDARDAKHSKRMINIFDSISLVTPVYESSSSRDYYESKARHFQYRNFSTERDYPTFTDIRGSLSTDRFYEMLPYGALPSMRPSKFYREISLPLLHPPELMLHQQPLLHHPAHIPHHLESIQPFYGLPTHCLPSYTPSPRSCLTHDKKDKFPNYLHHIQPEDDPLATRTLFAGNLEITIKDEELQCIFGKYGVVEDIDVKRPLVGTGTPYAFVRYQNLDMAHKAKVELSGKYIGKYECKIGYGKPIPTQRIWVGGLSPRTSLAQLEQEFDRFGVIKRIEYDYGDTCAHILFKSIDAAIAAVKGMRGVPLRGSTRRLRTDFANRYAWDSPTLTSSSNSKSCQDDSAEDSQELTKQDEYPFGGSDDDIKSYPEDDHVNIYESSIKQEQYSDSDNSPPQSPFHYSFNTNVNFNEEAIQSVCPLDSIFTLEDFVLKCTDVWDGRFVMCNFQYLTSCHLIFGDINIFKTVMKNNSEPILHINRHLRLREALLKVISRPEKTADMLAMFLAIPCTNDSISSNDASINIQPFHNLIFLHKQKMAIGLSLESIDHEGNVLCVFPPCEYSTKLLKRSAKNLNSETLKYDNYLVILVVSMNFFMSN